MIQRLNKGSGRQETLFYAHRADVSRAERAQATALTDERQVKALHVLKWVKFHLTSFILELL